MSPWWEGRSGAARIMTAMHLLVPFAAPLSEAGRQALAGLSLPRLQRLMTLTREVAHGAVGDALGEPADEFSRNTPHERALAQAWGLPPAEDGLVPLAAALARARGLTHDDAGRGWALLTPTHWRLGAEDVSILAPELLALDETESRAWFDSAREWFESEGFELVWVAPTTWLARHPLLATLPSASLDRVIGRNVDRWLEPDPRARLVRRLQNEVQMLWHTHPLNAQREARGQFTVTGLWVSGTGVDPGRDAAPDLVVDDRLRPPALAEDWDAWRAAWQTLDEGPVAALVQRLEQAQPATLTLCGERAAARWEPATSSGVAGLMQRLSAAWRRPDVRAVLEKL